MSEPYYRIQITSSLKTETRASLVLLYGPLIGKDAVVLYDGFHLFSTYLPQGKLNDLKNALNLTDTRYIAARKKLEQYSLIQSLHDKENDHWLFIVHEPKDPSSFLKHDVYSRLFLEKEGANRLDQMKVLFMPKIDSSSPYTDVSEPLDLSSLDHWTMKKEEALEQITMPEVPTSSYPFDFSLMFRGMERIIPKRLRTKENLDRIYDLARIFGVDEKTMRRYLMLCIDPQKTRIDFEALRERVLQARKIKVNPGDPYAMAPIAFLQWKQNGLPVSKPDKLLLEQLEKDYALPNEVMNVLIEYSLEATQQKFTKAFVEKVASSWARLKIDSKEKAMEQIHKKPNKKEDLPDWYKDKGKQEADPQLTKDIEMILKELEGESTNGEN